MASLRESGSPLSRQISSSSFNSSGSPGSSAASSAGSGPEGASGIWVVAWFVTVPTTRQLLELIPPEVRPHVRRLQRRVQHDTVVRHGFLLAESWAATRLVAALRRMGAAARRHVPYHLRAHLELRRVPVGDMVRVATYNIRGFAFKKSELMAWLHRRRIDVVCLQETLHHPPQGWQPRLPGYTCIQAPAAAQGEDGTGVRGLILAVRVGLALVPLATTPHSVWAKIIGRDGTHDVVVGCVYLPTASHGALRREALDSVMQLTKQYAGAGARVVVAGDWNCQPARVDRYLTRYTVPAGRRLEASGSPLSYRGCPTRGPSAIDHVVIAGGDNFASKVRVDRNLLASDHYPVVTKVRVRPVVTALTQHEEPRRGRITVPTVVDDKTTALRLHAGFADLLPRLTAAEASGDAAACGLLVNDICRDFEMQCWAAAEAQEWVTDPPAVQLGGRLRRGLLPSRASRRALVKRDKAWREAMRQPAGSPERDAQLEVHKELKVAAGKALQADRLQAWSKHVEKGVTFWRMHSFPGAWWRWVKATTGNHRKGPVRAPALTVAPVRSRTGELLLLPADILGRWAEHYGELASDATGRSRDPVAWATLVQRPLPAPVAGLGHDVTWSEVCHVLRSMNGSKAPGPNGIPTAILKLARDEQPPGPGAAFPAVPTSPMGQCIFGLIKLMVERAHIPECLRLAEVVSIPKGGDPFECSDYRGIALMQSLLKVAASLVIRRVAVALENAGFFTAAQAGFRRGEECVGHVVALHEVCLRRRRAGQETWIAFVDLKKAYDSVPHECLFAKLERAGVHGMELDFIRAVYADSRLAVRLPVGRSPEVQVLRGVRQGCPMSPTCFNVFINDVYDGMNAAGLAPIDVPGLPAAQSVHGLSFADDLAILAQSEAELRLKLSQLVQWVEDNDMRIGHTKCGIMVVRPEAADGAGGAVPAPPLPFDLHGPVEMVEQYRYLGIEFNNQLDLTKVARERAAATRRAYHSVADMIWCRGVPLAMRQRYFAVCVVGVARYGGELLGMHKGRAAAVDSVLAEGLRAMLGLKRRSTATATVVLRVELDVPSMYAAWSAARWRLHRKARTMRSLLGELARHGPPGQMVGLIGRMPQTWVTKLVRKGLHLPVGQEESHPLRIRLWLEAQALRTSPASAAVWYRGLEEPRHTAVTATAFMGSSSAGVQGYFRMRTHAFWTTPRLVRARLIGHPADACPCCGLANTPETVEHILLSCARWTAQRERLMPFLANVMPGVSREDLVRWLLGACGLRVMTPGDAHTWNVNAEGWCLVVMWQVVRFLEAIHRDRNARLWAVPPAQH